MCGCTIKILTKFRVLCDGNKRILFYCMYHNTAGQRHTLEYGDCLELQAVMHYVLSVWDLKLLHQHATNISSPLVSV